MNCLAIVLAPISPHLTLMPRLLFLRTVWVRRSGPQLSLTTRLTAPIWSSARVVRDWIIFSMTWAARSPRPAVSTETLVSAGM